MQKHLTKFNLLIAGILLLQAIILTNKLFSKSYSWESALGFVAGFATVIVCYLIFKPKLKKKK